MNMPMSYYNFKTKKYDYFITPPQDWRDYIPQNESVQNLYQIYLAMGKSPTIAAGHVLAASVGEKFIEPTL